MAAQNAAISGTSWTTLATTQNLRSSLRAKGFLHSILVMNGGTSDILDGDLAAQVNLDMQNYAIAARAAGYDKIVACTIPPSSGFSGPQEAERVAANALIRVNPNFDAVSDFASVAVLQNPADLTYYSDGTHWTVAGATAAFAVLEPAIRSALL